MLLQRLIGTALPVPEDVAAAWPETGVARFRCGGLPLRIGGWVLGASGVDGIALGRTVWLARAESIRDAELVLHELRHVQQFATVAWFPCRYLWESLVHGYHQNAFEIDARAYAARHVARQRSDQGESG